MSQSSKKNTSVKPANKPGKGGTVLPPTPKPFTSENQPSPEAKSAGKRKSKLLKDLLELTFKGAKGGKLRRAAANYLGIREEELTVEDMLHFRQIERAIGKSNTFAYMAVLDRAYGKPKQEVQTGIEGELIITHKYAS